MVPNARYGCGAQRELSPVTDRQLRWFDQLVKDSVLVQIPRFAPVLGRIRQRVLGRWFARVRFSFTRDDGDQLRRIHVSCAVFPYCSLQSETDPVHAICSLQPECKGQFRGESGP